MTMYPFATFLPICLPSHLLQSLYVLESIESGGQIPLLIMPLYLCLVTLLFRSLMHSQFCLVYLVISQLLYGSS